VCNPGIDPRPLSTPPYSPAIYPHIICSSPMETGLSGRKWITGVYNNCYSLLPFFIPIILYLISLYIKLFRENYHYPHCNLLRNPHCNLLRNPHCNLPCNLLCYPRKDYGAIYARIIRQEITDNSLQVSKQILLFLPLIIFILFLYFFLY